MNKIGFLAFIRPFYQKTMGFWALALIFGGVLMELRQHVLLGRFLFKNPIAFWILPFAFLVFGLLHLRIQLNLLRKNDYLVFHQLGLVPKKDFRSFWTQIILGNHSPLLVYFFFLSYFAWEQNKPVSGIILWLTVFGVLGFNFWKIRKTLGHPLKEVVVKRPKVRWTFPRFTWIILSLRQSRPLLFLLTKGLSLLLLNGFYLSFQSGNYDFRWLQFGVLCVSYFQLPLIFEKTEREVVQQTWILALPLTLYHKLSYQFGSLALLAFPELFFLGWKGLNSSLPYEYALLGALLLSFMAALQVLVYQKKESLSFPNLTSVLFFLLFLGIIFGLPGWVFILPISFLFINQTRGAFHF